MKAWFFALTQRERNLVLSAAAILVLFLFYLLVLEPVSDTYEQNKKNVANANITLEWMKSASVKVKQLGGAKAAAIKSQDKKFILGVVDRSVRKAGLAKVMKRVQPEGNSAVRVWFERAAFDDLISWIATIESKNALFVNEINIEETDAVGLVNVRLLLDSL